MRPANAWRTSNHQRFTEVDAGVLSRASSIGAFFIFRHEFVHANQRVDLVKVLGSGRCESRGRRRVPRSKHPRSGTEC